MPSRSRSRIDEMYARDLTCQTLGIEIVDVEPQRMTLRMRVADWMVNQHGIAHGGLLFVLADAAFAYACNTEHTALAQHAQITFLRPVEPGDELTAEAVRRAQSGRVGIFDVTVKAADGAVVAEFRGQSAQITATPNGGSHVR